MLELCYLIVSTIQLCIDRKCETTQCESYLYILLFYVRFLTHACFLFPAVANDAAMLFVAIMRVVCTYVLFDRHNISISNPTLHFTKQLA